MVVYTAVQIGSCVIWIPKTIQILWMFAEYLSIYLSIYLFIGHNNILKGYMLLALRI